MGPKILTVDDSEPIRAAVAQAFEPFSCSILEARDGLEGLALVARERPDIVLLDCSMPVMDGLDMLARLKADPSTRGIPVIMLTAATGRDNALRMARLGALDLLPKPFDRKQVVDRVTQVIPLTRKTADTPESAARPHAAGCPAADGRMD